MVTLKKEDSDFIIAVSKFCSGVEPYVDVLGLERETLFAFKSQNMVLNHLIGYNNLWKPELCEFFSHTLENVKVAYQYLTLLCKCSPSYNIYVGLELGIETNTMAYSFSDN